MTTPSATRATRALLAVLLTAALAACDIGVSRALPADEVPPPIGFPECNADAYDFAGQGTLHQLGLDKATPVPTAGPGSAGDDLGHARSQAPRLGRPGWRG